MIKRWISRLFFCPLLRVMDGHFLNFGGNFFYFDCGQRQVDSGAGLAAVGGRPRRLRVGQTGPAGRRRVAPRTVRSRRLRRRRRRRRSRRVPAAAALPPVPDGAPLPWSPRLPVNGKPQSAAPFFLFETHKPVCRFLRVGVGGTVSIDHYTTLMKRSLPG